MNSKIPKLLRHAALSGFVMVDTWLHDLSVYLDFCFCLITCTHISYFSFWRAYFFGDSEKYLCHVCWYIWMCSNSYCILGIWKMNLDKAFFVQCILYSLPTFQAWQLYTVVVVFLPFWRLFKQQPSATLGLKAVNLVINNKPSFVGSELFYWGRFTLICRIHVLFVCRMFCLIL